MDARVLVDDALEITILGSFSRPGFLLRRRLFAWPEPPTEALRGRTVLVTGATSGLGRAAAGQLAQLGARLILVSRNEARLARLTDEYTRLYGEDRFRYLSADMSALESVLGVVERLRESEPRLDVLIDNAGAIYETRRRTGEGLEMTFATMVVGPFVLISGLLPLLEASGDGRVISVVSGGMYGQSLPLDDLQYERGDFNGTLAYARAKRASTALVREWARRLRDRPLRVNAMHPGWADTPGLAEALPGFHRAMKPVLRTAIEGADTIVWLATDAAAGHPGGRLFLDRRARPFDRVPATRLDAAARRRLWQAVVAASGMPDPLPGA